MEPIKHIPGLEAIHDGYEVFLVDAWGVLHDGANCYPGVKHCLEQLAGQGKQVVVLSNAARRQEAISQELGRQGITRNMYRKVVSSGQLTWQALQGGHSALFSFIVGLSRGMFIILIFFNLVPTPAAKSLSQFEPNGATLIKMLKISHWALIL